MNEFLRFKYFINYQWRAKTKYYLHSPFVYQFYLNVLEGPEDEKLKDIDKLRSQLHLNNSSITIKDFGTGNNSTKTISNLESKVATQKKYGHLLYRLVKYFKPAHILELGTSIGLSSSYMALASEKAAVISLEGSGSLIETAKKNYAALGIKNVSNYEGDFDLLLPEILKNQPAPGLVFFDGNHRKDATLRYFTLCLEKSHAESIFIFDDIHCSKEMNEAWTEIKSHSQITLALDVFQFGICFFRKAKLAKEEFVLRY
jgi:predicted O-methyltransferase YrrM